MGFFDGIVDAIMDDLEYEDMKFQIDMYWYSAVDGGNEGQAAIAYDYCIPAGGDVLDGWEESWPNIEVDEYIDACMSAHEAAWDCWSDTAEEIGGMINEYKDDAQSILEAFWYDEEDGDYEDDDGAGPDDW